MVAGDHRPAVRATGGSRLRPALIMGSIVKIMPGMQLHAGAGLAVVQDLRVVMEAPAHAVAAEFAHHRKAVAFRMLLDGVADVAQRGAGAHLAGCPATCTRR